MLSIRTAIDLRRIAPTLVPRLVRLQRPGAEVFQRHLAEAARRWFDEHLEDGGPSETRPLATALHAWCVGVEATLQALQAAGRKRGPADDWFAADIAMLPLLPQPHRKAAERELTTAIAAAEHPVHGLIGAGRLEHLPAALYVTMKQVLLQRCEFEHVRPDAAALAVRAAHLGDSLFAEQIAHRLAAERPKESLRVLLALLEHAVGDRAIDLAQQAMRLAVRVNNASNNAYVRSDAMAGLVPALLRLPRDRAGGMVATVLAELANAPRPHLLLDLGALAPLFAALSDAGGDDELDKVVDRIATWWP